MRIVSILVVSLAVLASPAGAQLASDWLVPAVAHAEGQRGTYWRSDVSLHNPHSYELPIVLQFLPSGVENWQTSTFWITLYPYETFNLWDVLGPEVIDHHGTGALLVYADTSLACEPIESCQFLVTSRTYTVDPWGGVGEFGQFIPGVDALQGVDWESYGYTAGILNDGRFFRCNVGVASWSPGWTAVMVDVQDVDGTILATHRLDVPPYGHVQQRLATKVEGGSLVFYVTEGPSELMVFPYASVVNQDTGDPSFMPGFASVVGVSVTKKIVAEAHRQTSRPQQRPQEIRPRRLTRPQPLPSPGGLRRQLE